MKEHRPRRGSLQFVPKSRAAQMLPRARSWPEGEGLLGFVGYKVGMATALVHTTNDKAPLFDKDIAKAVTVVEVPPMILKSIRLYRNTHYGSRIITEANKLANLDTSSAHFARFVMETQPKLAGFPKKVADSAEIAYGGDIASAVQFATDNVDKELKFNSVFSPGSLMDVTGVTKGKGLQGPVKRYGIRLLPKKTQRIRRKPGALAPTGPSRTPWQVPMAGKMGFHTRTEYNKQVLTVGTGDVNPSSGWKNYGLVKSDYTIILGSLQGSPKRVLKMRKPIRPDARAAYEMRKLLIERGTK